MKINNNREQSYIDQRNSSYDERFKFTGKEKDAETDFNYFGARYYDAGVRVWLSVDPMAHKYPDISPYMYCVGNPVKLVDPDGRWVKGAGLLRNLFKSDSRIKAEDKVHEFKNKGYLAEKHKDKGTKEWYVSFYKKSDDEASDRRVSGTFCLMYFNKYNKKEGE